MSSYKLFEVFGIELEYMIVDQKTLNVQSIADEVIKSVTGAYSNDVENSDIDWSNELVSHVIELKNNKPTPSLTGVDQKFSSEVTRLNQALENFGCKLMPGAVHPWMNPETETKIWQRENNEIYNTYHKLFGCHKHGWANLQSMHINISFSGDKDFNQLHTAVRTILALVPGLCSSSPVIDGQISPYKSARLNQYLQNQKKIPSIMGLGIPEACQSQKEYQERVLQPMYKDISPLDSEGNLQEEWLNSRGAIPKFERGCIEIRLADLQECPQVDLAMAWFWTTLVKQMVDGRFADGEKMRALSTEALRQILDRTVQSAEDAIIDNQEFLGLFGLNSSMSAKDLLQFFLNGMSPDPAQQYYAQMVQRVLNQGTLSTRILKALDDDSTHTRLSEVYNRLCQCLAKGEFFEV